MKDNATVVATTTLGVSEEAEGGRVPSRDDIYRFILAACLQVFGRRSDEERVSRFAQDAQSLLEAAGAAAANGESRSEMTILIGRDGGIHMVADSDWPLESLAREHGARSAYRVSGSGGAVRVEGREGGERCLLESDSPARTARLLLGA
jgi:hypothetical protein